MRIVRSAIVAAVLTACAVPADAAPILIDFETFGEFDDVGAQFAPDGIVFSNATVLVAGSSVNEFDFPPSSGFQLVYDANPGGIRVDFLNGATSVSGRFTYVTAVTMTAFAGATELGSVTSLFDSNYASSGNPVNEMLQLAFAETITHVTLVGGAFGGSFVLDDFFAETRDEAPPPPPIPEPATITLLLAGGAVMAGRKRLERLRRQQ